MLKSELIERLQERFPHLHPKDVDAAVRIMIDHMAESVASGDRIEIRRFGSFVLKAKAARLGRNPKTGAAVNVPASHSVHFRAGQPLRQLVDARRHFKE